MYTMELQSPSLISVALPDTVEVFDLESIYSRVEVSYLDSSPYAGAYVNHVYSTLRINLSTLTYIFTC